MTEQKVQLDKIVGMIKNWNRMAEKERQEEISAKESFEQRMVRERREKWKIDGLLWTVGVNHRGMKSETYISTADGKFLKYEEPPKKKTLSEIADEQKGFQSFGSWISVKF